jgi:hypothetical protein
MSTLTVDTVSSRATNADLSLVGNGTGVPNLETGTKLNGTALTSTFLSTSANIPNVAPGTSGNLVTSNGSAWTSAAPAALPANVPNVAPGTSGNLVTSNGSAWTSAALSANIPNVAPGTSGNVVTSNGSAWTSAAAAAGGVGSFTPTGGNSISIGKNTVPLQNETGTTNNNIGLGDFALQDCTSSVANVAIGQYALSEVSSGGGYNTAVGIYAGQNITSGDNNTAMSNSSLYNVNTGGFNSGYGRSSLVSTTSGSNNTGLGYNSEATGATTSNEITLGNSAVSTLRCQVTSISSLSDERDKAEITDLPEEAGLDLINSLRPRTFYWDMREWYDDGVTDGSKIKRINRSWKSNSGMRQGFIAQEVESAIAGMKCLEDSKVVSGTEDKKEVAPANLLTNAIKAIQQLSSENKALLARIEILEKA